jgi:hypothetical protein
MLSASPSKASSGIPENISSMISATFRLFGQSVGHWIGIALRVMLPMALLNAISLVISIVSTSSVNSSATGAGNLITAILSICISLIILIVSIFVPWMNGALTYSAIQRILGAHSGRGEAPSASDAYSAARPKFGALWAANFVNQLVLTVLLFPAILAIDGAILSGLTNARLIQNNLNLDTQTTLIVSLACCLPLSLLFGALALHFGLGWSVHPVAIVGEGSDALGSLGRSNKIVNGFGSRMRLFGRHILFRVVLSLLAGLPALLCVGLSLLPLIPLAPPLTMAKIPTTTWIGVGVAGFVTMLTSLFVTPLMAIFNVYNYFHMRARTEGFMLDQVTRSTAPASDATAIQQKNNATPIASAPDLRNMTSAQRIGALYTQMRTQGQTAPTLNEIGKAYQEVGDLGAALDAYTHARELDPSNADIAFNLMRLHMSRKDLPAARAAMNDYLQLETNSDDLERVKNNPAYSALFD